VEVDTRNRTHDCETKIDYLVASISHKPTNPIKT
jgi:hypothetical protein